MQKEWLGKGKRTKGMWKLYLIDGQNDIVSPQLILIPVSETVSKTE